MNKPECKTYPNGDKVWYLNGKCHREDGPACELASGYKEWYLNGKLLTEKEHQEQTQGCTNKVIEIDGKQYKLVEAQNKLITNKKTK